MATWQSAWERQLKSKIRERYSKQAFVGGLHQNAPARMAEVGYSKQMISFLPTKLQNAFSGCGCPVAGLTLVGNEVVVDLGSGAGIDSFLVKKELGSGSVIAVDLSQEMLRLAQQHTQNVPINLVTGDLEQLPLKDCIADIVIANASFNLAINKNTAYKEALRILKPGGKLAAWDLIRVGDLPKEVLENPLAHTTSLGGVVEEETILTALRAVGFTEIKIRGHSRFSLVFAVSISARRSSI